MITKDRNRAIVQLACAFILTVPLVILLVKKGRHMSQDSLALLFLAYLGVAALWMVGSYSLAKAKGYDGHTISGVFLFLFIVGFCIPMVPFLFPGIVLLGLPDKTRVYRRRSRSHASK